MTTTRVVTPPSTSVLTLAEACAQARIESGMDDTTIQRYVKAATQHIETVYGVAMLTQTKELVMDEWPCDHIELVDYPVVSITSVKYTLSDGTETTWANTNYSVGLKSNPVRIVPNKHVVWPYAGSLRPVEAIAVRYVAGFGEAATDVPEPIRQAVALLTGHWYINRENVGAARMSAAIEHGVHHLMSQWR